MEAFGRNRSDMDIRIHMDTAAALGSHMGTAGPEALELLKPLRQDLLLARYYGRTKKEQAFSFLQRRAKIGYPLFAPLVHGGVRMRDTSPCPAGPISTEPGNTPQRDAGARRDGVCAG